MMTTRVHTWADGFGIWHASVPLTASPKQDAQKARRAIIAELRERVHELDPRRVQVELERVTAHGTVTYREIDN